MGSNLLHISLNRTLCDAVRFPDPSQQVECIGNILYQSNRLQSPAQFLGLADPDSRAYRFSEQLLGLNQDQAYQHFLQYWIQSAEQDAGVLYLIVRTQNVVREQANQHAKNRLLWALQYNKR